MKTALVLGASGLVGSYVLEQLLEDQAYSSITVLARKLPVRTHAKIRHVVVDFNQLNSLDSSVFTVTDVFSCLGTTLGRTGDPSIYRRIEVEYPLFVAKSALSLGAHSFHYVSAIGSSSKALTNYSRMKGDTEDGLQTLQKLFPQSYVASYRPSFILGPRREKRLLEQIAIPIWSVLEIFMHGPLRKFRSVHAEIIARAMTRQASSGKPGFYLWESDYVENLGT